MFNSEGYLRLIDFGLARIAKHKSYTLCGTPEYLAPEIMMNKGYSLEADWWAFGVLLYEMLVGVPPFNDDDPYGVYQAILAGKYKFPRDFPFEAKDLIKKLLVADPSKRLKYQADGK